jgi:hypothetical protein
MATNFGRTLAELTAIPGAVPGTYCSLATRYLFSAAFERTEAPPVVPHET